jgi:hypothetical protein
MAAAALQVINFDGDPRGRRYGPEDRERAYGHWLTCRSLARTARVLGIAENSIRAWAKDDGWVQRAERDDAEAAEFARRSLASVATNEVQKSLETVLALRDDPATPAKTRLDAAIFVLGIWGVAPVKLSEVSVRPAEPKAGVDGALMQERLASLSSDELMALEAAYRTGDTRAAHAILGQPA